MKFTKIKIGLSWSIFTLLFSCQSNPNEKQQVAIQGNNTVTIVGAMKNVMHKGELFATIDLDTIKNKTHLYGLGPLEYLQGEILIVDGKGYKSIVENDTSMKVTKTMEMKAPFFGYSNIDSWTETEFPDNISNVKQLEKFLDQTTKNYPRPFLFKLTATVDSATIHIVNLAKGTKVSSPEEAHKGQKSFYIKNKNVEMLGFFSTEHQAIFTHHDTYVHIHLITDDKQKMGHLEELMIKKGTAKLYLPTQIK
jgi:acetolactate decarboxylase